MSGSGVPQFSDEVIKFASILLKVSALSVRSVLLVQEVAMFKALIVGALAALVAVSVHSGPDQDAHLTTIDYSPYYQLTIPTSNLAGARFFSAMGPSIRFSDSVRLGGWVTNGEEDGLPEGFDLALYPRYVLGLDASDALPADMQRLFSLRAYGISQNALIAEDRYKNGILYSACDYPTCLFFVTHQAQNEHILILKSEGFDTKQILGFLEESNAE